MLATATMGMATRGPVAMVVPSTSVRVSGTPRAARAGFAGTPAAVWSARGVRGGGVGGGGGRRAAGGVWVAAGRGGREDQKKAELQKMEQQMGSKDGSNGKPEVKVAVQSAPMPAPFGVPLPALGGGFVIAAVILGKVLGGRNKGYAHPANLTI